MSNRPGIFALENMCLYSSAFSRKYIKWGSTQSKDERKNALNYACLNMKCTDAAML